MRHVVRLLSFLIAVSASTPALATVAFGTPVTTGGTFAPGSSTLTASLTVSTGSTIVVGVLSAGITSTLSVADNVNGAYTQLDVLNDASFTSSGGTFAKTNSASGSVTITVTFGTAANFPVLSAVEITGAATGAIDGHAGAVQSAGSGSALSSGNFTSTAQPALLIGWAINDTGDAPTVGGSGFTIVTTAPATGSWEWKRVTATGTQAATYTSSDFGGHMTFGLAVDESSGAGPTFNAMFYGGSP